MQNIKRHLKGGCLALMALALSPLTALETQAQYQLTQFPWGFPSGINNGGTIVVNGAFDPETFEEGPALVDGDSVTLISIPNAFFPNLGGINAQGTVVGSAYTEDFSSSFGFVRTKDGQVTVLNIPGAAAINPSGINSRVVVVGLVFDENFSSHSFIWDATGPKLFDAPDADSTELTGINASGSAVGNYTIGGISHPFTLSGSRFTPLNIPGASSSFASGINSRGQIVGSYSSPAHTNLAGLFMIAAQSPRLIFPFRKSGRLRAFLRGHSIGVTLGAALSPTFGPSNSRL